MTETKTLGTFERIKWTVHVQVRMKHPISRRVVWANVQIPVLSADVAMATAGAISTARNVRRVVVEVEVISVEHVVRSARTKFKKRR